MRTISEVIVKNSYAFIQPRVKPADLEKNFNTMAQWIVRAREMGAIHFVFPELMLTGYLIGDAWEEISFIRDIEGYHAALAQLINPGEMVIFGSVTQGESMDESRSIASITKLMTAMVVIDAGQDPKEKLGKFGSQCR